MDGRHAVATRLYCTALRHVLPRYCCSPVAGQYAVRVNTNSVQVTPLDIPSCALCDTLRGTARWLVCWSSWGEGFAQTDEHEEYVCHEHLTTLLSVATAEPDMPTAEVIRI